MKKLLALLLMLPIMITLVGCNSETRDFKSLRIAAFSSGTGIYYFKLSSKGLLEVSYGNRKHFKINYNIEEFKNENGVLKATVRKVKKLANSEQKKIISLEKDVYQKKVLALEDIYAATDTWAIYMLIEDKLYSFYAGESNYTSIDKLLKELKLCSPIKINEEVFLVD